MYSNEELKTMIAPIIEKYKLDQVFLIPSSLYKKLKLLYSFDREDPDTDTESVQYPFLIIYHRRLSIGDIPIIVDEIEKKFFGRTDVEIWNSTNFSSEPAYLEIIDLIVNKTEGNLIYEREGSVSDKLFFITKSKDNGTEELVKELDCTEEEARQEFLYIVNEQCREYHIDKTLKQWRIIRLYDANHNVIAQES